MGITINPDWLHFYHQLSPFKLDWTRAYRALRLQYGAPHWGSSRVTFLGVDYVYKLPISWNGIRGNESEAAAKLQEPFYPIAYCEIAFHTPNGLPVLRMERVEHADIGEMGSGWWNFVDCGQVGYTASGELVAYDYAEIGFF